MSFDIENRWFFLGIIFIGLFSLLSCKEKLKSDAKVFKMNMAEGLETTDPAFAKSKTVIWVDHQLYNTLVKTDPQLNIVPSLAKSWEVSEDGKIFTFHLRNDVYFHDNDAF